MGATKDLLWVIGLVMGYNEQLEVLITDVADDVEIEATDDVAIVIRVGALWIGTFTEAREATFAEIDMVLLVEQDPEGEVSDEAFKVLTGDLNGIERL